MPALADEGVDFVVVVGDDLGEAAPESAGWV